MREPETKRDSKGSTAPPLTAGQRRHVEGSLRQLDAEIAEALQWFRQNRVPGDDSGRVLFALHAVRGRLQRMADRLDLSLAQEGPDPGRRLAALAGHWWGLALDCRSHALRGYGAVDPEVAGLLDPLVGDLADELLGLGCLAEPHGKPPAEPRAEPRSGPAGEPIGPHAPDAVAGPGAGASSDDL